MHSISIISIMNLIISSIIISMIINIIIMIIIIISSSSSSIITMNRAGPVERQRASQHEELVHGDLRGRSMTNFV